MPTLLEHVIAAAVLVAWPAYSAAQARQEIRELASEPDARLRWYWITIAVEWAACVAILAAWQRAGRPWDQLGLGAGVPLGTVVAGVAALAVVGFLWRQIDRVRREPAAAEKLRRQLEDLEPLLPQTPAEHRAIRILCVTAGICEEIAFRGFALWYLTHWMPMPAAVAVMAASFATGHLYQGVAGAAKVAAVGVAAALLYLLSGSLWIPIVLHALLDLMQFELARSAMARTAAEQTG